mmetsp:Transcript_459/g.630  ORF Transcript_459/g.630 Transcript_459/m.630 type:complete len:240 (-) Transcript_459:690-1409(-)
MEASKSVTPYFVEDSVEFSFGSKSVERRQLADEYEYDDEYDRMDNGLGDDYDFDQPLQPLIPLKYTTTLSYASSITERIRSSDNDDDDGELQQAEVGEHGDNVDTNEEKEADEEESDIASSSLPGNKAEEDVLDSKALSDDLLELFFNTFLDSELEGEITVCQWMSALGELCVDLSEKEMYRVFNYISCDACYLDAVDFAKFCQRKLSDDNDANCEIGKLQRTLNAAIMQHPFMTSAAQ